MKVTHSSQRRRGIAVLAVALGTLVPAAARSQPGVLYGHSAIYDPPRQRMVVFGGQTSSFALRDSAWEFSLGGTPSWRPLSPPGESPEKRQGHSAVYDSRRERMLIFGGLDSTGAELPDVWDLSLAGTPAWSRLDPEGSPGPRAQHSAIYDSLRDRMVIFGGLDAAGKASTETWCLWLTPFPRWEQLDVRGIAPPGRFAHSAIYDPVRDQMVVFSGNGHATNDTWAFSLGDTGAWTSVDASFPPGDPLGGRFGHAAIYDPDRDRMVVFGGIKFGTAVNEVWSLALAGPPAWSHESIAETAPPARVYHSGVYDRAYGRWVVYGGFPGRDDVWALALGPSEWWSAQPPNLRVSTARLQLPTVTVGDTVFAVFTVSNGGLEPLHVDPIEVRASGTRLSSPGPFDLHWGEAVAETLFLAASNPSNPPDSLVLRSSDSANPRDVVSLVTDVREIAFETHVLGNPTRVPLGSTFVVVVTPTPPVRIDGGKVYFRISNHASRFDSLALAPLATGFLATIPDSAVTDQGVDYYVRVENSGFGATQPASAPSSFFTQAVTHADSFTAIPRSTSGADFLIGRPIEVAVRLPDGSTFHSGQIHFRRGGETAYSVAAVEPDYLGRPVGSIPDSTAGPRGVEYWVEVSAGDTILRFPSGGAARPAAIRTRVPNLVEPAQHPAGRYRLLSIPLDFGDDFTSSLDALLTDQFGTYDPTRWRAYTYDPASRGNVEFSAAAGALFIPEPGRAFWLITRGAHRVDSHPVDGFSTPTNAEYPIALQPGWNPFGNPFDFPVAWTAVRKPAGVGDPVAFDPARGSHGDYADSPPAVLEPFEGYFVFLETGGSAPETMWVSPREAPAAVPAPAAAAAPPVAGGDSRDIWRCRLRASTALATDDANEFGLDPMAAEGLDPLDAPEPPETPGPWVRVAFAHPEWRRKATLYRHDVRGPGLAGETWDVEVRSATAGEPIALDISDMVAMKGLAMRLIDREQGVVVGNDGAAEAAPQAASRSASSSERIRHSIVSLGPQPYRLSIVAGTEAYVARATADVQSIPARLRLDPSAPNPFRFATRIRFGLPRSERVTAGIYSVLGERVASLRDGESFGPGYHSLVWDGMGRGGAPAPSGVYLLRLAAGRDVLTTRIVLIR